MTFGGGEIFRLRAIYKHSSWIKRPVVSPRQHVDLWGTWSSLSSTASLRARSLSLAQSLQAWPVAFEDGGNFSRPTLTILCTSVPVHCICRWPEIYSTFIVCGSLGKEVCQVRPEPNPPRDDSRQLEACLADHNIAQHQF